MKGNVIGFDPETNTGAISGFDGQRYDFTTQDWRGHGRPRHGDVVDFQAEGHRATQVYLVEPEYVQPSLRRVLFLAEGADFPLAILAEMGLAAVGDSGLHRAVHRWQREPRDRRGFVVGALIGLIYVALLWPSIAIQIKRVHDRDWPWAFILVLFIPIVNIWPMIEIMFLRGTVGSNRFGPDPVR